MRLDALTVASDIDDTYRRYLKTLMPVDDPGIEAAFHHALRSSPSLLRGPFLEMTPPYAPGATIRELVGEGVLAKGMLSLDSAHLPVDRPLYRHQEQACRKAAQGRNIVVASGTGSGKTESFLLPILSSLFAEHEAGTLGPGVRAVLLYPLNALANDQMKRLRQLLAGTPQITFGRYTGETAEDLRRAQEEYAAVNPHEPLLANELICRQQMRADPPHLLLTNYAMLEYLLLRHLRHRRRSRRQGHPVRSRTLRRPLRLGPCRSPPAGPHPGRAATGRGHPHLGAAHRQPAHRARCAR
jgi:ATP-dependent helicase YprA (DUF1998 family)